MPPHPPAETPAEGTGLESILTVEQRGDFAVLIGNACGRMRFNLTNIFEETLIDLGGGGELSPVGTPSLLDPQEDTTPPPTSPRTSHTRRTNTNAGTSPALVRIQQKCIASFESWRDAVLARVLSICNSQKPCTWPHSESGSLLDEAFEQSELGLAGRIYPPIRTPLSVLPREQRAAILESLLLILLSLEHYDARSRTLLLIITSSLQFPIATFQEYEAKTAATLIKAAEAAMSAEKESQKRIEENKVAKRWKVGLASVGGAVLIGVTGGLAAPLVAAGVGTILGGLGLGATAVGGLLGAIAGSSAIVGALFGAYGAKMTGEMVERYAAEVEDFAFIPMQQRSQWPSPANPQDSKLRVTIAISGWLASDEDIVRPWRCFSKNSSELYALRWETDALLDLGTSLETMFENYGWTFVQYEILKRTVLATLYMALWPLALMKAARLIDNPYSIGRHRSEKAGKVLADALMNHVQGLRPVNLVGYGLGARVIYFCLLELAKRGGFGLVHDVYLLGAPVPSENIRVWKAIRSVAAGRVVNGYSSNDWILGFLERGNSMQTGIAGLQEIKDVSGIENVNLGEGNEGERIVEGHLRYGEVMGVVLKECKMGGLGDLDKEDIALEEGVLKKLQAQDATNRREAARKKEEAERKKAQKEPIEMKVETHLPMQKLSLISEVGVPKSEASAAQPQVEADHPFSTPPPISRAKTVAVMETQPMDDPLGLTIISEPEPISYHPLPSSSLLPYPLPHSKSEPVVKDDPLGQIEPMPINRTGSVQRTVTIGDWTESEGNIDDVMEQVERELAEKKRKRMAAAGGSRGQGRVRR